MSTCTRDQWLSWLPLRIRTLLLAPLGALLLWSTIWVPTVLDHSASYQTRSYLVQSYSLLDYSILEQLFAIPSVSAQSTITVNSTMATVALDGRCTLNEAIANANANAATYADCKAGSGPDTIAFDIQGPGPHTIALQPGRELNITDSVMIDGLSQPAYGGLSTSCKARRTLLIELDGSASGKTTGLIIFNTSKVVIRGLTINSFAGAGIHVVNSQNVLIQCNHIGTNPTGNIARPNANAGIQISSNSEQVVIGTNGDGINDIYEYNVISGNGKTGVLVNRSHNNVIAGNRIGVDVTGIFALGNGGIGIQLFNRSRDNLIGTNSDGIADDAEANTVSSNGSHGISVFDAGTNNTRISGNKIGTNVFGTLPFGNGMAGINVTQGAAYTTIGGPKETDANILSGNSSRGVWVQTAPRTFAAGRATNNTTIQGNYIGVDIVGRKMGNNNQGVLVQLAASTVIMDNLIEQNLRRGIFVKGGEAVINNNIIRKNGQSGIEVTFYQGRDTSVEAEARNPDDVIPSVTINGNDISKNCHNTTICAGIMATDVAIDPNDPTNGATLAFANDIGLNSGFPDIAQYWYGAIGLIDENVPISFNLVVESSNNGPDYSMINTQVAGDELNNIVMRGPVGFSTTNIETWPLLLDFIIDEDGTPIDYTLRTAGGGVHYFPDSSLAGKVPVAGYQGDGIISIVPDLFTMANDPFGTLRYQIFEMDVPVITIDSDAFAVDGQTATITATLNTEITKDVAIVMAYGKGSNVRGRSADVELKRSEIQIPKILIPAGETSASIKIPVSKALIDDGEESLYMYIVNARNAYNSRRPLKINITE